MGHDRTHTASGLVCMALLAFAGSCAATTTSNLGNITVPFLIQTHLEQAGLLPQAASQAQIDAAVQKYTALLQQRMGASQATGSPVGMSGQGAKALVSSLDQAYCSCSTSNCPSAGGRKLRAASSRRNLLSPVAKDYAELAVWAAAALLAGDNEAASQVIKYSGIDPEWASCIIDHIGAQLMYRPAASTSAYTYPLQSVSGSTDMVKIAILGDWGTGQPQALDMLDRLVQGYSPDMVMHLGDVYYSGTPDQQEANQYQPATQTLKAGMQYYAIPGNHDYYSGGQGFYATIDKLRQGGVTQQQGSFFALEGPNWVFIGLDTGITDTNPVDVNTDMPYLVPDQLQWALAKISAAKAAGKRVILTTHHQLFTAHETVGTINNTWPAVNPKLRAQLEPVLSAVDAWFWGHEHTFQAFQPYAGLKRGRMLGNSAVPMLQASQPYAPNSELTLPPGETTVPQSVPGSPQSALASFGYYLQHSFAILTLQGGNAKVDYYQADWNCWVTKGCAWYNPTLMWTESF